MQKAEVNRQEVVAGDRESLAPVKACVAWLQSRSSEGPGVSIEFLRISRGVGVRSMNLERFQWVSLGRDCEELLEGNGLEVSSIKGDIWKRDSR